MIRTVRGSAIPALTLTFTLTFSLAAGRAQEAAEPAAQDLAFFEAKIRPVLVRECYGCHSAEAEKLRGGLLLDSRAGWMAGGESGPVIVPGKPSESVILSALRYEKFEMPPKAKLAPEVVADFERWIELGAPDPRTGPAKVVKEVESFDLATRKDWWSLRPPAEVSAPKVKNAAWPRAAHDRFILAKLEAKSWEPAEPASRPVWLRRVTYDLTGLPPTPEELAAFESDETPEAFETVVDRLLRSPHFGEQWARHWMDLVRYAETKAFEADYPMPNAYQYRDYLIRAFSRDVPYDRFVSEHLAGDLLDERVDPVTGRRESPIGLGYLYLTDGQHGPPDIHADEARIFDDMIDVVGKTFLAQTLACARCHDHKFDAISTRDYYSLYGVIASSRIDYADINPIAPQEELDAELRALEREMRPELAKLLSAELSDARADLASLAGEAATERAKRWKKALEKPQSEATRLLKELVEASDDAQTAARARSWRDRARDERERAAPFGGVTYESFGEWLPSGRAFGTAPRASGDFVVAPSGDRALRAFVGGRPAAGVQTSRVGGSIRSPGFTIEGDRVTVRVKGQNARVSLYVRHYELVGRGPTTGGTTKVVKKDGWQTLNFGTRLWQGEPAYIEVQHNGGEVNFNWSTGKHEDGAYVALHSASTSGRLPPLETAAAWGLDSTSPATKDALLDGLSERLAALAAAFAKNELSAADDELLEGLLSGGFLELSLARSDTLREQVERYRELSRSIPPPTYVRSLTDGHGQDEPVYIRGSHKNRAKDPNPRHFLEGIDPRPFATKGSGRREWAEALVSGNNPLTARVWVNRVWHHLYGRGIVASVDDFGHMGDKPSHPELLDFLARRFVKEGWSTKKLIREIALSASYRMASRPSVESWREDPDNIWLQHMPVRRLQAEAIRDTLLAVSGQLDPKLFGPAQGGDGGRRRSVYIQLRRRYMPEFLMTFDMPNSTEPFGRRNVTSGPAQSLAFLNGGQVWRAAEHWGSRIAKAELEGVAARVDRVHREAFGRAASEREQDWARALLEDLGASAEEIEQDRIDEGRWRQLCHTMLNRKELIHVQ